MHEPNLNQETHGRNLNQEQPVKAEFNQETHARTGGVSTDSPYTDGSQLRSISVLSPVDVHGIGLHLHNIIAIISRHPGTRRVGGYTLGGK
jgi:hypothetical protein